MDNNDFLVIIAIVNIIFHFIYPDYFFYQINKIISTRLTVFTILKTLNQIGLLVYLKKENFLIKFSI